MGLGLTGVLPQGHYIMTRYSDMAYFTFLLVDITYDIDPWSDLDLETQK